VVTSKGDNPWVVLSVKRDRMQRFACDGIVTERRVSSAMKERLVALFYLIDGIMVVVRGDGDVSY
jgi:hypothetical protein